MRLSVLGSNGTYPTAGRPASGYLITAAGTTLALDLGPGVFMALVEKTARPDAVVLSHGHPDHCADLFALFNSLRFGDPSGWGVPVWAPLGLAERFAGFLGVGRDHPLFSVFTFEAVGPGDRRRVGSIEVEFGTAVHSVPALVTAVVADGRRLVYSGDTGPGGDLEHLAERCDLLLVEASMQGEPGAGRYPFHLFAYEAGEVATRAGVRRLIVTHLAPTLDPQVSVREAAARFDGPVDHAVPGMEVEL
ncbi:MAG: MBL fold metallo-hydrolase [Acidimicrobiia bacterium]